jgi:hypothetical protein
MLGLAESTLAHRYIAVLLGDRYFQHASQLELEVQRHVVRHAIKRLHSTVTAAGAASSSSTTTTTTTITTTTSSPALAP